MPSWAVPAVQSPLLVWVLVTDLGVCIVTFWWWLFFDCTRFFCGHSELLHFSYSLSENDLGEESIHSLSEGLPCFQHLRRIEWVPGHWQWPSRAWLVWFVALPGRQRSRWCWCRIPHQFWHWHIVPSVFSLPALLQLETLRNHWWCFKITFSRLSTMPFHGGDNVSVGWGDPSTHRSLLFQCVLLFSTAVHFWSC